MQRHRLLIAATIGALCIAPLGGHASDGALEINQVCATSLAGCFAGDTLGFPVTITQPGSYRLTSNLSTTLSNQIMIQVNSAQGASAEIDLAGFEIVGPADCSTFPCINPGGRGIWGVSGNLVVRDGTVRGFGTGLALDGSANRVERMRVVGNASLGIGMNLGGDSGPGIIEASVISGNGGNGVSLFQGEVRGCLIVGNQGRGVGVGSGSEAPSVSVHQSVVLANVSHGITARDGTIVENISALNGGAGLLVTTQTGNYYSGYASNVISGNGSTVANGGQQTGPNVCNGSTTCP